MKIKDTLEKLAKEYNLGENMKDIIAIAESFDNRNQVFSILQNDVRTANNDMEKQPDNQYCRRTYTRAAFSMIEGLLNVLNQTVLDYHKNGVIQLTPKNIEDLTEERTDKNGEIRPSFMTTSRKIVFSFSIFAKTIGGTDYRVDTTTKQWDSFEKAIHIRNRITHPRILGDMIISDGEMITVLNAAKWFSAQYSNLEKKVGDMLTKKNTIETLVATGIKDVQSGKK